MSQSDEMLQWGGDNWLRRNKNDVGKHDLLWEMLPKNLGPEHRICEIGCANGWRLRKLKDQFHCEVYGVEPSQAAVDEALTKNHLIIQRGVAHRLPLSWNEYFNVVIMGFCLWLIEPSEWFKVVAESDRILKNNGLLYIHDYIAPRAFRIPYDFDEEAAKKSAWAYHYDWPKLWLSHPAYLKISERVNYPGYETICALRKNENCMTTEKL